MKKTFSIVEVAFKTVTFWRTPHVKGIPDYLFSEDMEPHFVASRLGMFLVASILIGGIAAVCWLI